MRLADADLLPFNFGDLSTSVAGYVGELQRLAGRESGEIRERNREIAEGLFSQPIRPQPSVGAAAAGGRGLRNSILLRSTERAMNSLAPPIIISGAGSRPRRPAAHPWRTAV